MLASDKRRRIFNWLSSSKKLHLDPPKSSIGNEKGRKAIAEAALSYVATKETLLLDAGSTAFELAKLLPDIEMTVLTPSLRVAAELANREFIRLVLMGGKMRPDSLSCRGPITRQALERYHVHRAFLSWDRGDLTAMNADDKQEEMNWKCRVIELADHTYLLAENWDSNLAFEIGFGSENPGTWITDHEPARKIQKSLKNSKISIVPAL